MAFTYGYKSTSPEPPLSAKALCRVALYDLQHPHAELRTFFYGNGNVHGLAGRFPISGTGRPSLLFFRVDIFQDRSFTST